MAKHRKPQILAAGAMGSLGIFVLPALATSPDSVWERVDPGTVVVTDPEHLPTGFGLSRLDVERLLEILAAAPREGSRVPPVLLQLPVPDTDDFTSVEVVESPISNDLTVYVDEEMVETPPLPTSYALRGAEDGSISGRLLLTGDMIRVFLHTSDGVVHIDPWQTDAGTLYGDFLARDRTDGANFFVHVPDELERSGTPPVPLAARAGLTASMLADGRIAAPAAEEAGTELRVYSFAVAATGEYFALRAGAGDMNQMIQNVIDSIFAEVSAANARFEPEVAVRLSFDWAWIYTDGTTDPYSQDDPCDLDMMDDPPNLCTIASENVALDAIIGSDNYDLGFVLGSGCQGLTGCAGNVVCDPQKYRGAGLVDPNAPPGSAAGLLFHESGHQLGASHTWSGQFCDENVPNNFNAATAVEPGSGSTVMSYLGVCDELDMNGNPTGLTDNVDVSVEPAGVYYHGISFDEIIDRTQNAGCGAVLATGNDVPTVMAGPDFTIPRDTPFVLNGSAMDAHPLTFVWEQMDAAGSPRRINTADQADSPLFRSIEPRASATRFFPRLPDLLSGTVRLGEILPTVDRTMTFRLTARDNLPGGGGVASDEMTITVDGAPFFLISPNGGETEFEGCPVPVTWEVGGSIDPQVDLSYSDDGGDSFGLLSAAVPNDGADSVILPCGTTNEARMMARGSNNIFFDVSDADFDVASIPPTVGVLAMGGEVDEQCEFTVEFSATVEDDCGLSANDVDVNVIALTNNFTLGTPVVNVMQVDPVTASVDGTVLVSDLTSSPATVAIEVIAEDGCDAAGSDAVEVDVVDTIPPTLSVDLDPDTLWPPNHKLREVTATVVAEDNCPGVVYELTSVASDEPDDAISDGHTTDDIQDAAIGTMDTELLLRAERQGKSDGRVYTVIYTATDGANNMTMDADTVSVTHNQ